MRHTPEAGAVCGNSARTDLRGGRGVNLRPYRNTYARPNCAGSRLASQRKDRGLTESPAIGSVKPNRRDCLDSCACGGCDRGTLDAVAGECLGDKAA